MLNWAAVWHVLKRGWCQHPDLVRLHLDGVWVFACSCGYTTPVLKRAPGDTPPPKAT